MSRRLKYYAKFMGGWHPVVLTSSFGDSTLSLANCILAFWQREKKRKLLQRSENILFGERCKYQEPHHLEKVIKPKKQNKTNKQTSCLEKRLWMTLPAGPLPAPMTVTSGFSIRADRKCSTSLSAPLLPLSERASWNLKRREWARATTSSQSCSCFTNSWQAKIMNRFSWMLKYSFKFLRILVLKISSKSIN